jgi:hypothetical protein
VSVLDGNGALLWPQDDRNGTAGFDSAQLRYLKEVEAAHLKRVMDLLEPVVGRENLRATVTAEVDFSQIESTAEEFKPNQGDNPAAVRASRIEESSQADANKPSGVPGATTNQPPVPATAPMAGASAPLQGAQGLGANGNSRRESETNYEVDKTVRDQARNATGTVRRLHAAVVVNHRTGTDNKGKPTSTPLTDPELEKLTALVQQGIGFNQERGDSVRVVNAPFRAEAQPPAEAVPFYMQPWAQDLLRVAHRPGALALVALAIVFGLIRPAVKAATAPPPRPRTTPRAASSTPWSPTTRKLPAPPTACWPWRATKVNEQAGSGPRAGQGKPGGGGQHRAHLGQRRTRLRTRHANGRQGPGRRSHPADVARRGRSGRGLQAPGAKEVQKLGETIAKLKTFRATAWPRSSEVRPGGALDSMLVTDTDEYVKSVLRKALGDDKANLLIDRILQGSDTTGIESLKWMDPGSVAELLRNEHPQIVAAILVHLDSTRRPRC